MATTVEELLEEAKRRTIVVIVIVLTISYCMSLTSNSVWINIPVAVLILAVARRISMELVVRWRQPSSSENELAKYCKRLSPRDPLVLPLQPSRSWRSKIDSPALEAAIDDFTHRIVSEFVTNLWYSAITPDQEVPQEIRDIINGVIGEISIRAKQVNLMNLLTSDVVNLVASHLESYRETQDFLGPEFGTLSCEERDERIKERLSSLKQLHPAVSSLEMECQVLQKLMGGVLAVALKPDDAKCKLVRCIARELLACAVMRPVMNFASPRFINEIIEWSMRQRAEVTEAKPRVADDSKVLDEDFSSLRGTQDSGVEMAEVGGFEEDPSENTRKTTVHSSKSNRVKRDTKELHTSRSGDWVHAIEAFNERKTQSLEPEHLDNLWAKGRNYKKKEAKKLLGKADEPEHLKDLPSNDVQENMSELQDIGSLRSGEAGLLLDRTKAPVSLDDNYYGKTREESRVVVVGEDSVGVRNGVGGAVVSRVVHHPLESTESLHEETVPKRLGHRRSQSSGGLDQEKFVDATKKQGSSMSSIYKSRLSCRVAGAHYEKAGSKSFAVYSVSVTNADGQTWVVLRRYRNFEKLHRRLRDMPHYALSLPPKRFLSSNLDGALIRERCVLLNKYLKDLLSIPSIAELHEVFDFLSVKSQNYGFGESISIMKTLAVNVDDAVDDVFRQIKGVTGGGLKKITFEEGSGTGAWSNAATPNEPGVSDEDGEHSRVKENGWHSDSEVHNSKYGRGMLKASLSEGHSPGSSLLESEATENDPPHEWSPPKLTVPLLNLVDIVFQLEGRGWIRRQVLWIAKQVLQLGMGDAIDDWLLTRVQYLRREDVIVSGVKWIQEALWPDGIFLTRHPRFRHSSASQVSFEEQLETARRAMVVRELIQEQAPAALVSLIGRKQYRRCAKDIYGFLQSSVYIKQLAYDLLEKLLVAAFPELDDLIVELHNVAS